MKILYDCQAFDFLNFGGVPRYFYELTRGITKLNHAVTNSIRFSENVYTLDKDYFNASPFFLGPKFRGRTRIKRYLNKRASIKYIKENKYDIFHPTYYDPYFLKYLKNKPYVVTFHDMIHEKFSNKYEFLAKDYKTIVFKKEVLKKAQTIISVSETTKKDLIDIYQIDADKIKVIGLGNSIQVKDIIYANNTQQKYILYVGNRVAWKNFNFCIEAIASTLKSFNLLFICAGGGKFTDAETAHINKLGLKNHVKQELVTDIKAASLYGNAYAFIFPSTYEGFGIPVLEAFACGCPCLLSNRGSLPEVGGEAALYFDPEDGNSIQKALNTIITDRVLRNSLIVKGKSRLKHFSWDITCKKTLQIYQSVINDSI